VSRPLEEVHVQLVRLNSVAQGVAIGTVLGAGLFLATNVLVLKGGPVVGPHLALLGQFLLGYDVSFRGSFVGLAYGFVGGFAIGYAVGETYNRLAEWRRPRSTRPPR